MSSEVVRAYFDSGQRLCRSPCPHERADALRQEIESYLRQGRDGTVELHQEQQHACIDQAQVGDETELRKRRSATPECEQSNHDGEGCYLADLNPQIETENAEQHAGRIVPEWQFLKTRRQPESMQQAEDKDGGQQVRGFHVEVF